jgi:hypothetical protein
MKRILGALLGISVGLTAAHTHLGQRVPQRRILPAVSQILRRDLARDSRLPVRRLEEPRTVHRYTTAAQARRELRQGLRPGTHTTSNARRGRPPAADTARRRYGLPRQPQVRETIRLPAGTPVRAGKVIGGKPGVGELVLRRPLGPKAILRVIRLRR